MQIMYLKVIFIEAEEKISLYLLFYQNRIMHRHLGNSSLNTNYNIRVEVYKLECTE